MLFINQTFQEERSLYGLNGAIIDSCKFAGEKDGESPLKECKDITVNNCYFDLRYPFWHVTKGTIRKSELTENSRAAFWYDKDITVEDSKLHGIKAFRECKGILINDSSVISPEFGWRSKDIEINRTSIEGEYPFFEASNLMLNGVNLKGKYSFQYVVDMQVKSCSFDTKDAFWHTKDVTVIDSVIKGEYLGWYSDGLTFINCTIIGTQPLCYAKNLKLVDCKMVETDLAFERSEVDAKIIGSIDSIKNPIKGRIEANTIGEMIIEDDIVDRSKTTIVLNISGK